jgi:hypothetical protein
MDTMSALMAHLQSEIARLEVLQGSSDPVVLDLKEQLRASKAMASQSAAEVFGTQAFELPKNWAEAPAQDDQNRPETEADGIRAGSLRLLKARRQSLALTGRIPASLQLPASKD